MSASKCQTRVYDGVAILLLAGAVILGIVVLRKEVTPTVLGSNWERICYHAPHRTITPQLKTWLRQEGVVEQRGWTITPAWLNANCDTVPGRHRR